jgi:RNA polymerase primary sigma factor
MTDRESPRLDRLTAAVKRLIALGRERGHVTDDEINAALPPGEVSAEMVEDTIAALTEMGIRVVEAGPGGGEDEART